VPAVRRAVREAADRAERRRLEVELRRRAEELAEADRRKDNFLALLAHELRNPLAPVRNALQILRLNDTDPSTADWARAMIERLEHDASASALADGSFVDAAVLGAARQIVEIWDAYGS